MSVPRMLPKLLACPLTRLVRDCAFVLWWKMGVTMAFLLVDDMKGWFAVCVCVCVCVRCECE